MYAAAGRVTLNWMVAEESLAKLPAKILLNLALIAGDALVRGGQLDIGAERRDSVVEIVVRAEGPKIVLDPELRAALGGKTPSADITSRSAAAWMVHVLVAGANGHVMLSDPSDPVLLFGASLPA